MSVNQSTPAPTLSLTSQETQVVLKGLNLIQRNTELEALNYLTPIAAKVSDHFRAQAQWEQKHAPPSPKPPTKKRGTRATNRTTPKTRK